MAPGLRWACLVVAAPILLAADSVDRWNGFDVSEPTVSAKEIIAGGPPRDGIRSVDAPTFTVADVATWVASETPILGVEVGGEARVYPLHLLEYHQIVNDTIGGVEIAVTYGPLAGTPRAFRRKVDGRVLEFGVSGLLYNSNFLFYDRQTESLWSQFEGKAISGPLKGKVLSRVPIHQEIQLTWLARFPESKVLDRPELKKIDYRYSPFKEYWIQNRVPYPVAHRDERYHAKELALGVEVDGKSRAYLGSILTAAGGYAKDEFEGRTIQVDYDTDLGVFRWEAPEDVEVSEAYWFSWKAFRPNTRIWGEKKNAGN